MNRDRVIKVLFVTFIVTLSIAIIGFTYSYFALQIEGSGKNIVVDTGDLRLKYTDNTALALSNAVPGDSVTKTITVANIGGKDVKYSLYWDNLLNEILRNELTLKMECKSYTNYGETTQAESGTCDDIEKAVPLAYDRIDSNIKTNISIGKGITHEYKITVTFIDTKKLQNYNKRKSFIGNIGLKEANENAQAVVNCSTGQASLTQGDSYENGQYTYHYMQHYGYGSNGISAQPAMAGPDWVDSSVDGWGVILTDKDSTDAVTSQMCTYIDNKPVVFYDFLFYESQTTSIDLSSFNTSNVLSMKNMFDSVNIQESSLDFSKFDTSKVQTMQEMFGNSAFVTLDLSSFDTSNVTSMYNMFYYTDSDEIKGIETFDTSKVTTMAYMFAHTSTINPVNTRNLNTSNVIDMSNMFYGNNFTSVDVRSFDTNKVETMAKMFAGFFEDNVLSEIKGVENLDTSNVTDMTYMFSDCIVPSLDLSKWDTSKVTNMNGMFSGSKAKTLNLSGFNTKNVTSMHNMFCEINVETLDLSSFDLTSDTVTTQMFMDAVITNAYAKNDTIAGILNNSSSKPTTFTFTVKS